MTDSERDRDRPRQPVSDTDAGALDHQGPPARPSPRRDPAAMRETLDAARRRLGPAEPAGGPPQSAAHQRALLREAVASRSVPLVDAGAPVAGPAEPPAAPSAPPDGDTVAEAEPDHRD